MIKSHSWFGKKAYIFRQNNHVRAVTIGEIFIHNNIVSAYVTWKFKSEARRTIRSIHSIYLAYILWLDCKIMSDEDDDNDIDLNIQDTNLPILTIVNCPENLQSSINDIQRFQKRASLQ